MSIFFSLWISLCCCWGFCNAISYSWISMLLISTAQCNWWPHTKGAYVCIFQHNLGMPDSMQSEDWLVLAVGKRAGCEFGELCLFFPSGKSIKLHLSQCLRLSIDHLSRENSLVQPELVLAQIMSIQWFGTVVSPFLLPAEGELSWVVVRSREHRAFHQHSPQPQGWEC